MSVSVGITCAFGFADSENFHILGEGAHCNICARTVASPADTRFDEPNTHFLSRIFWHLLVRVLGFRKRLVEEASIRDISTGIDDPDSADATDLAMTIMATNTASKVVDLEVDWRVPVNSAEMMLSERKSGFASEEATFACA